YGTSNGTSNLPLQQLSRPQSNLSQNNHSDINGGYVSSSSNGHGNTKHTVVSFEPKKGSAHAHEKTAINSDNDNANVDMQLENIRRTMMTVGAGRGKPVIRNNMPKFFSSSSDLQKYLGDFNKAIFEQNSSLLCSLLSIRHNHIERLSSPDVYDLFERVGRVVQGWNPILTNHINVCQLIVSSNNNNNNNDVDYNLDSVAILQNQLLLARSLLDIVKEAKNKNWQIPILILVITELRLLTNAVENVCTAHETKRKRFEYNLSPPSQEIADLQIDVTRKQNISIHTEKSIELITEAFRVCTSDRCQDQRLSKKWGSIQILNQLLKLCHRIKKYDLCDQLLSFSESNLEYRHHLLDDQTITYNYFLGKSYLFKDDYRKSIECLDPIFIRCPKYMKKNKSSILLYLCLCKMQYGYTPKLSIIEKYNLKQFYDLLRCVRCGNLYLFDYYIKHCYHSYFLKNGLTILVDTLYLLTIRNLFRNVWLIKEKENKITVDTFLQALIFSSSSSSSSNEQYEKQRKTSLEYQNYDRFQCCALLATLIAQNRLKAYISYKHLTVVLSKEDPFPKIIPQNTLFN
ncbi:unnamed protein product, partial [Didymodactylos carnosus]